MMFQAGEPVVGLVPDGCNNLLALPAFHHSTIPFKLPLVFSRRSRAAGLFLVFRVTPRCINTSGIVSDKPIETLGDVGKAALTSGASTVLKLAAKTAGLSGNAATVEKAAASPTGTACADGCCTPSSAK